MKLFKNSKAIMTKIQVSGSVKMGKKEGSQVGEAHTAYVCITKGAGSWVGHIATAYYVMHK